MTKLKPLSSLNPFHNGGVQGKIIYFEEQSSRTNIYKLNLILQFNFSIHSCSLNDFVRLFVIFLSIIISDTCLHYK